MRVKSIPHLSLQETERFWEMVDRRGPDECWEWIGARNDNGYGTFTLRGVTVYAHRISWAIENGRFPESSPLACHECDNPPCVNPGHIFAGDHAANAADMNSKGRGPRGRVRSIGPERRSRTGVPYRLR